MDVRAYSPDDRAPCLAVFDSNVPRFFAAGERAGFESFLDSRPGPYAILEHEGVIVGCGGWAAEAGAGLVRLTWGMVKAEMHGMGIGRFLLLYRLRELAKNNGTERVRLATSQHTAGFFQKQGFKVHSVEKDGYAPGIDRVEMIMKLTVCS